MRKYLAIAAVLMTAVPVSAELIPYQNSGNRWVDSGPSYYDNSEFSDESRHVLQVWKVYTEQRQVVYWTRTAFSKRHAAYLNKTNPGWNKEFIAGPMGPYLVNCTTKVVNHVQQFGDLPPTVVPIGEDFPVANHACRLGGFEVN